MAWLGLCSGGLCPCDWWGAMVVVVLRVLAQDLAEVLFAVDQQVAGALAAQSSHVALREGVRPR